MKHKLLRSGRALLLLTLLLPIFTIQAQVTVGLSEKPVDGAMLQLKDIAGVTDGSKNANKGLMLPRVELVGVKEAKIGSSSTPTDFTSEEGKKLHTGLVVYNLKDNTKDNVPFDELLCPGPYVWMGNAWDRLFEPCDFQYSGEIDCQNNISHITVGVCQELDKLGSFQLTAYNDAVIRIKHNDELGSVTTADGETYTIIARKVVSGPGDTDTYTVTQYNSPVDIDVIVKGPSTGSQNPKTFKIPIDLSGKITGGSGVHIKGCPYSMVEITANSLIVDPAPIIFTSGRDGLSFGYQAYMDDGKTLLPILSDIMFSYIDDEYLVRPWGIRGIKYEKKTPGSGATTGDKGTVMPNSNYWPLMISWQPTEQNIKIINPASSAPQKYDEPKFTLKGGATEMMLPRDNLTTELGCGYITYKAKEEQPDKLISSDLVWEELIVMDYLDKAPLFTEKGEQFIYNRPYTLSKKIQVQQIPSGETTTLDLRQIHYGTEIIASGGKYDNEGKYYIENFNLVNHNYEFKFKIRSNTKWRCTGFDVKTHPANTLISFDAMNLSSDQDLPDAYGPEEDAYGEPRTREVTVKFKKEDIPTNYEYLSIFITLENPKLYNKGDNGYAGQEFLYVQLYKGNK